MYVTVYSEYIMWIYQLESTWAWKVRIIIIIGTLIQNILPFHWKHTLHCTNELIAKGLHSAHAL